MKMRRYMKKGIGKRAAKHPSEHTLRNMAGRQTAGKSFLPAALFVSVSISAGLFTGCIPLQKEPILAEKESKETASGTNPAGSLTDEIPDPRPLFKKVEAPARYTASLSGESIRLDADAEISVPAGTELPRLAVSALPYTEAERTAVLNLLCEQLLIPAWQEGTVASAEDSAGNQNQAQHLSYTSPDGFYQLSLSTGNALPMIWLQSRLYAKGPATGNVIAVDISESNPAIDTAASAKAPASGHIGFPVSKDLPADFPYTGEEASVLFCTLSAKAESLLSAFSSEPFLLTKADWRELGEHSVSFGTESTDPLLKPQTAEYGLRLRYERDVCGQPVADVQYVEFLYRADGTPLMIKNIGRAALGAESGESFYLPFEAAAQIFEQYAKTLYSADGTLPPGIESSENSAFPAGQTMPFALLSVSEVRLEYLPHLSEATAADSLVPVWSFYGSYTAGRCDADDFHAAATAADVLEHAAYAAYYEDGSLRLLSIGAKDGTLYPNRFLTDGSAPR